MTCIKDFLISGMDQKYEHVGTINEMKYLS